MRKRRSGLVWILLVVVIAVGGFGLWFWLSSSTIKKSEEFTTATVHFAFVCKDENLAYFIRVDTTKRMIYVLRFPQYSFNPLTNRALDVQNPLEVFSFSESMIESSSNKRYYAVVSKEQISKFSKEIVGQEESNFENLLKRLANRTPKAFDYLFFRHWISTLKPETTFTPAALAKLMYELQRNAVRYYYPEAVTNKPIEIITDGKKYQRVYLDANSIQSIKDDIKK